jgi:hypothetical protein
MNLSDTYEALLEDSPEILTAAEEATSNLLPMKSRCVSVGEFKKL